MGSEENVRENKTSTRIMPLLQALFAHDADGTSDGALLSRFLNARDEGAFAILVRRHGSMVLSVCRRILGNHADAEDACQAAFLVLVRKAPSLVRREVVGDWLHGVARRTALKSRSALARRRQVEPAMARPEIQGEEARDDLLPRLDAAIARLPEKYRLPIVLCDMEGKTRQQAAAQLHWPEGTVAGRLARARELLRKRLLPGTLVVAGAIPGTVGAGAAKAAMPIALMQSTIESAALFATGELTSQTVLSGTALTLAKGVLQTMFWNKMKIVALALFATVVLAGVGGRTVQMLAFAHDEQEPDQPPARAREVNDVKAVPAVQAVQPQENKKMTALTKELLEAANAQWAARITPYGAGIATDDFILTASKELLKAELMSAANKGDRSVIPAYQAHLDRMLEVEKLAKTMYDAGRFTKSSYAHTTYARVEAQIMLEEAQHAAKAGDNKTKKAASPAPLADKQDFTKADEPDIKKLVTHALESFMARWEEYIAGKTTVDFVLAADANLLKLELMGYTKADEKFAIYDNHIRKSFELYTLAKAKFEAGEVPITGFAQTKTWYEDLMAQRVQASNKMKSKK
jgi:RNA polymerase sigma factor (sigma-70 family)